MPETTTYTPGQTFQAKVIRKDENKKSWVVKGKKVYRHDLYLVDMKTKQESIKEWISNEPSIPLTTCPENAYRWFRVTKVTQGMNDEVEPFDEVEQTSRSPLKIAAEINNSLPKGAAEQTNCQSLNITGKSITYCTAWAKDLKVAEIAKRPDGAKVTEEDIEDVAKWAISLNEKLCEFVNF